ncbi:hypothetical protein Ahy_B10g102577 [Arachis hypogaea]|uniref:Leucine-rich repeat-containing N-terminal plant-type domain-containing protein n=1 Tax=Arachis hypogaea TaxID=3818 RepID=A0A444X229_ARAHY|nr:hypothetical protein Ahy_B10g102577 [Arachis hypogaea]
MFLVPQHMSISYSFSLTRFIGYLPSVLATATMMHESIRDSNDMNNVQLNDDVLGLIVFKSDLHDPSSSLASWKDDSSACSWNRVQCNPATGRVTEINLAGLGLSGRIGKGLEKLQHLMKYKGLLLDFRSQILYTTYLFVDAVDPKSRHKGKLETENLLQSREDIKKVFLTGATSKLGRAITFYLCRKKVKVLGLKGKFSVLAVFGEVEKKNVWIAIFDVEDPRSKVPHYKGKFSKSLLN